MQLLVVMSVCPCLDTQYQHVSLLKHACINAHARTHARACTHARTRTTHTHTHTCTHTHTYTHTLTHIYFRNLHRHKHIQCVIIYASTNGCGQLYKWKKSEATGQTRRFYVFHATAKEKIIKFKACKKWIHRHILKHWHKVTCNQQHTVNFFDYATIHTIPNSTESPTQYITVLNLTVLKYNIMQKKKKKCKKLW
jgi:hypothetical protein